MGLVATPMRAKLGVMHRPGADGRAVKRHLVTLVVVFAVTRALAVGAGFRYTAQSAVEYWQFMDLELLQHHLLRSLWHLHAQPPLFNGMVGVAEKLAGGHYGWVMLAIQWALGLGASVAVYLALVRLRVKPVVALVAALGLMLNPSAMLFEFDGLYTEAVYGLNCLLALAMVVYVQERTRRALGWVVGLAVCLPMLRSSYQWVWVLILFAVLAWVLKESRRAIAVAGAVALGVTLLVPAKNLLLFGHFTSSTWGSFGMAKHWDGNYPRPDVAEWMRDGTLVTLTHTNDTDEAMEAWLRKDWAVAVAGSPELDALRKATGGRPNWNSLAMLKMHEAQARDVGFLLRHEPGEYGLAVVRAVGIFFQPTSDYMRLGFQPEYVKRQYGLIGPLDAVVTRVCCTPLGVVERKASRLARMRNECWMAVVGYLLVGLGVVLARGDRRTVIWGLAATIVYALVVTNLAEVGENMRFRFETEGLVVMVAVVVLQMGWERWRGQVVRA